MVKAREGESAIVGRVCVRRLSDMRPNRDARVYILCLKNTSICGVASKGGRVIASRTDPGSVSHELLTRVRGHGLRVKPAMTNAVLTLIEK